MGLPRQIVYLFIAAALELLAVIAYAIDSQTLMITTVVAMFLVIKVAINLIHVNREKKKNASAIRNFIGGEIIWLKAHREKLNYKLPEKLKEYTDNRITYLEKLKEEAS